MENISPYGTVVVAAAFIGLDPTHYGDTFFVSFLNIFILGRWLGNS